MPAIAEYVRNITRGATTIFEGMAVTFSHLLRPPITTRTLSDEQADGRSQRGGSVR